MGCSSCGGARGSRGTQEYLITYRDGTTERVSDMVTVRQKLSLSPNGGNYRLVAKKTA